MGNAARKRAALYPARQPLTWSRISSPKSSGRRVGEHVVRERPFPGQQPASSVATIISSRMRSSWVLARSSPSGPQISAAPAWCGWFSLSRGHRST